MHGKRENETGQLARRTSEGQYHVPQEACSCSTVEEPVESKKKIRDGPTQGPMNDLGGTSPAMFKLMRREGKLSTLFTYREEGSSENRTASRGSVKRLVRRHQDDQKDGFPPRKRNTRPSRQRQMAVAMKNGRRVKRTPTRTWSRGKVPLLHSVRTWSNHQKALIQFSFGKGGKERP